MAARKPNLKQALAEFRGVVMSTTRCILQATIDEREYLLTIEEIGEIESLVHGPHKLRARRAVERHVLKRLNYDMQWRLAGSADRFFGLILAAIDRLQLTLEAHQKSTGYDDAVALASQEVLQNTDFAASLCIELGLSERPGLESIGLLLECYEREDEENDLPTEYTKLLRETNELLLRLVRVRMEAEKKREMLWHMERNGNQYKCFVPSKPIWRECRTTNEGRARRKKLIYKRLDHVDSVCQMALRETQKLMREYHHIYNDACALIVLESIEEGVDVSHTIQRGRRLLQEFNELAQYIMDPDSEIPDVLDRIFAAPSVAYQEASKGRFRKKTASPTEPTLSLPERA